MTSNTSSSNVACTVADPNIPPKDGKCHLLELPGEIRNVIYSVVLAEKDKLKFVRYLPSPMGRLQSDWKMKVTDRTLTGELLATVSSADSNQLRLVNKELYKETNGLGLRYNSVAFENHEDASYFIRFCNQAKLQRIKEMHICPKGDSWYDFLGVKHEYWVVFNFLYLFPHAKVRLHSDDFYEQDVDTLESMAMQEKLFRGTHFVQKSLTVREDWTDGFETAGTGRGSFSGDAVASIRRWGQPSIPPNFRFHFEDAELDLKILRKEVQKDGPLKEKVLEELCTPGGVKGYIELIDNILENGF